MDADHQDRIIILMFVGFLEHRLDDESIQRDNLEKAGVGRFGRAEVTHPGRWGDILGSNRGRRRHPVLVISVGPETLVALTAHFRSRSTGGDIVRSAGRPYSSDDRGAD